MERERDRLLSLANVQRMRAQIVPARATLQQALQVAQGLPGPQVAPVHELIGDLWAAEERWALAATAYEQAHLLDPARATAERKFGEMTIRVADEKALLALGAGGLSADSFIPTSGRQGRRNPALALLGSLILPGFGQFYNGQLIKGAVCLGLLMVAIVLVTLTPDVASLRCAFQPSHTCHNITISPVTWFSLALTVGVWLYSLIDAPVSASRIAYQESTHGAAVIDKSGWEV
jgi:hypothetical protein